MSSCSTKPKPGYSSCFAVHRTDVKAHKGLFGATADSKAPRSAAAAAKASATGQAPTGYGPAELQNAYDLPSATAGGGRTVAIVDAFDDPNAEADLGVYRSQYGLSACTTANGCFRKVAQDGTTRYPRPDPTGGWGQEVSLDLDMVSAICPDCHILLVEATDNGNTNLGIAASEAVALGAKYVSNSYGSCEDPAETTLGDSYYNHPGVVVTASSGDDAYDNGGLCSTPSPSYPASSPYVTAVGGTTLTPAPATARGWTETAWADAGSGCSLYEPKPAWQTDADCANRMDTDVSAVADPNTGVAVYDSYAQPGWDVFGGTSVASPIIASVYALAGTPAAGTYPSSYPYLHASALNDVTSGNNNFGGSCTPTYACNAGPGYDGPTGLGTPEGTAAFTFGAHGMVTGTVTSAATRDPVAGAQVDIGSYHVATGDNGRFSVPVPPGSYTITTNDYAYATSTAGNVQVRDGQTLKESIALSPVPTVKISGAVADGSGAGWPLYAKVSVTGAPVSAYTNPATGNYSLTVPASASYTLTVDSVSDGYQQATASVQAGTSNVTHNFSVPVDPSVCSTPGYQVTYPGSTETFDGSTAPNGWSVTTARGNSWEFDDPGGIPNLTGGSGNFAVAVIGSTPSDTTLLSPVYDLSQDTSPVLRFNNDNEGPYDGAQTVDVSTDGGQTWTNVWYQGSTAGNSTVSGTVGPDLETVPLPMAAGKSQVQIRFEWVERYGSGETQKGGNRWEIDNVFVGDRACSAQPGGLVVGTVKDARTGAGVNGAIVASVADPSARVTTAPSADPAVGDGFWSMFVPATGSQQFTVTDANYPSASGTATVTPGAATPLTIRLAAGRLAVMSSVTATAVLGKSVTRSLTFTNTGSAPVTVTLHPQTGGFTEAGQRATVHGQSVKLIKGTYSPEPVAALKREGKSTAAILGATLRSAPAAQPADAPWTSLAQYPIAVIDNSMATDPATGLVYSVGGAICCDSAGKLETVSTGYVYDPATLSWTALPAMPFARDKPSVGFIDGKLYVAGGFDNAGNPVPQVGIYDPATQTWATGASMPLTVEAAGTTVLNGNLYVIGGCDYYACDRTEVQVYHPATNTWTTAADYPEPVSWEGCGTISGKIYCAGGDDGVTNKDTSDAYAYDPAANNWSAIAPYPIDNWAMGYGVGNGQLLLSGGVTRNTEGLTNQGWAYDPANNTWTALPNNNQTTFRGGSACGFYMVGGIQDFFGDTSGTAQQLPGYSCGTVSVPWLAESQTQFTLSPGAHTTVTVTLDAGDPSVTQPGTYTAALDVTDDTPYLTPAIGLTLNAQPPATWGKVTGTVTGTNCNGSSAPLSGALMEILGSTASYTLDTDPRGRYSLWIDQSQSPLTIIAAPDNWQTQVASANVQGRRTTTANFTLIPDSC